MESTEDSEAGRVLFFLSRDVSAGEEVRSGEDLVGKLRGDVSNAINKPASLVAAVHRLRSLLRSQRLRFPTTARKIASKFERSNETLYF